MNMGKCYTWMHHDSDITWTSCLLKSPANQLFVQLFIYVDIKENIRTHCPFVRESTGNTDSPHKGPVSRKLFLCGDIMLRKDAVNTTRQSTQSNFYIVFQTTRTLGSISIKQWSDTFPSDWCLIDVDPRCLAIGDDIYTRFSISYANVCCMIVSHGGHPLSDGCAVGMCESINVYH